MNLKEEFYKNLQENYIAMAMEVDIKIKPTDLAFGVHDTKKSISYV